MKYKMYSIHDSAVKVFLPPHYCRTHGEAERNFTANVNNSEMGHLHSSPGSFTLFHVGEYNDETGQCTNQNPPEIIMTGIQAKRPPSHDGRQMDINDIPFRGPEAGQ